MHDLVVVAPVLGRPHRARPLADSLAAATTLQARLLFMCTRGDDEQIDACRDTGADLVIVDWPAGRADFQRKINLAFQLSGEPFLFQAADDLDFETGWDTAALERIEADGAGVCGTNDCANPLVMRGEHSTHSLIRRTYIEECGGCLEGPGIVFSEAYNHQRCDNELVELARVRGCFTFAADSIVRHRHPVWRTAEDDATYRRGASQAQADTKLFHVRRRQWQHGAP